MRKSWRRSSKTCPNAASSSGSPRGRSGFTIFPPWQKECGIGLVHHRLSCVEHGRSFVSRGDHGDARDNKKIIAEILSLRAERARLLELKAGLGAGERRLVTALRQDLSRRRARLAALSARLAALSPLAVLERGYAIVQRASDARVVRRPAEVSIGDALHVRVHEGSIAAKVTATKPERSEDE